jgi:Ca-activated chloride channel family protein
VTALTRRAGRRTGCSRTGPAVVRRAATSLLALAVATGLLAQSPEVVIVSPQPTDYVSGPVRLRARVEGTAGKPSAVAFYVDGRHACTVHDPPYECDWDSGTVLTERIIRVVATFAGGRRQVSTLRTRAAGYVESVNVDVVQVPVVVTDGGRFVRGLTRDAFVVREDGVPQTITHFGTEDSPLDLVVAVDVSGSMAGSMPELKSAVRRFLAAVRPGDAVTVLGFNDTLFTVGRNETDVAARLRAVDRLTAWGGTALYDAAAKAVDLLGRRTGRKALIVFTDGEDRSSRLSEDEARRTIESSNAMFYAIAQGRAVNAPELRRSLERFAGASGGRAFFERNAASLDGAFRAILDELSNHYMLGYAPRNTARDGTWRRIDVDLPGRRHRVRARQGYLAAAAPSAMNW